MRKRVSIWILLAIAAASPQVFAAEPNDQGSESLVYAPQEATRTRLNTAWLQAILEGREPTEGKPFTQDPAIFNKGLGSTWRPTAPQGRPSFEGRPAVVREMWDELTFWARNTGDPVIGGGAAALRFPMTMLDRVAYGGAMTEVALQFSRDPRVLATIFRFAVSQLPTIAAAAHDKESFFLALQSAPRTLHGFLAADPARVEKLVATSQWAVPHVGTSLAATLNAATHDVAKLTPPQRRFLDAARRGARPRTGR